MAIGQPTPVHQADEDNVERHLPSVDARQGAISGRVVTVLIVSMLIVCAIFAVMWLTRANL
jgi:hypothetical protein